MLMRSAWSENFNFNSPHAFNQIDEIATNHWAKLRIAWCRRFAIIHMNRLYGSVPTTDSIATFHTQLALVLLSQNHNCTANIYLLASKISLHANCSHRRRGTIKINIYLGHTLFYFSRTIFHTRQCILKCNRSDENLYTQHAVKRCDENGICVLYGRPWARPFLMEYFSNWFK